MPAGGGQLGSGQCIGGIVSSNLHLHWPGTPKTTSFKCMGGLVSSKLHLHWPGTPKASSALESKELSSFHKRAGSRASSKKLITALAGSKGINYRGAFMSTNEHQNHFSHVDQVSTNCVNTRKKALQFDAVVENRQCYRLTVILGFVRRSPQPSESVCRKGTACKKHLLDHQSF